MVHKKIIGKRLEPIERQRAKERQIRKPKSVVENLPPQNKNKFRDKIAEKLGINESVTHVEPYFSWFWKYTKDHNLMGKDEDYEEELNSI